MKKFLLSIALILATTEVALGAYGINAEYSPFVPKVITKIDALEALPSAQSYSSNAVLNLRVAKAYWNIASSSDGTVGAHSLGVALPAGALITQSYLYSALTPVSAGGGTVAVHCEDANNIATAANITSKTTGSIWAGNNTGTGATMVAAIASACNITATVASSDYTAGKVDVYVQYVVHD